MYLEHFGLKSAPFDMQPDVNFYCPCETYKAAEELVDYCVNNNDIITKIIGPVGVGKTLMIERIKTILPEKRVCVILNPNCTPQHAISNLLSQLPMDEESSTDPADPLEELEKRLYYYARDLKSVVLVIDEAQTTNPEVLETLRLFTNLHIDRKPIFQMILIGQPELNKLLQHPLLQQINQRINFSHEIIPLNNQEVRQYLQQRINNAGGQIRIGWEKGAIDLIYKLSSGLPRHINKITHKALLLAYFQNWHTVKKEHVMHAAKDSGLNHLPPPPFSIPMFASVNAILLGLTATIFLTRSF